MNEDSGGQNQGEQSFYNLKRHRLWSVLGMTRCDRVDDDIYQRGLMTSLSGSTLSTIETARRGRRGGKVGTG